jgi:acylglycerol lipase
MTNQNTVHSTPSGHIAAFVWYITAAFQIFIEPLLCHLNLMSPGFGDATYGRSSLPRSQAEKDYIFNDPKVTVNERVVYLQSDAIRKGGSWERPGSCFVAYSTWQIDEVMKREKLNADIVLLHGINNYGGKAASVGRYYIEHGFRVIAIDLPSFGRSSGLHSYLPSLRILVEAVHSVMKDVIKNDPVDMRGRKIFMQGESMGGFTALYYAALYPPVSSPSQGGPDLAKMAKKGDVSIDKLRPNLSGVACSAPMLAISPQSRPSPVVESIAKMIAFFAGRLPFAEGVKGNVSNDIRVEHEFQADAQTYKGNVRIGTGLAILAGMADLQMLAPRITVPCMFHVSSVFISTDTPAHVSSTAREERSCNKLSRYRGLLRSYCVAGKDV